MADNTYTAQDKGKVLIIDDVEVNRFVLRNIIADMGYQPILAENGIQGLKVLQKCTPNLILLDISMPEMDGYAATRMVRSMDRADLGKIPIIAMTANVFDEDIERSVQAGMNAHLSKPIEPDKMYETLARLIKEAENR